MKKVSFDIDGVLVDIHSEIDRLYRNKMGDDAVIVEKAVCFEKRYPDMYKGSERTFIDWYHQCMELCYTNSDSELNTEFKEAVGLLVKNGIKVCCVTKRCSEETGFVVSNNEIIENMRRIFEKSGIGCDIPIYTTSGDKSAMCTREGVTHHIDDYMKNVLEVELNCSTDTAVYDNGHDVYPEGVKLYTSLLEYARSVI